MKKQYRSSGFTLIELLVVIVVLGILAVALLMGINPLEQINKGKDAGKVSRAKEVINAAERVHTFSGWVETDCDELATTYGELKSTDTCADLSALAGPNPFTITFTPDSSAYSTLCSGDCVVPIDLSTIGGG